MKIGDRLFPYPVINREKELSDFKEHVEYKIYFEDIREDSINLILEDIFISITDEKIRSYMKDGLLESVLIVESPESVFRRKYKLSEEKQTIRISLKDLEGDVTISSYLYARQDIEDYSSPNFSDELLEYDFKINKYDIVGVDDGFSYLITHNKVEDNIVESIFMIIPKDESTKRLDFELDDELSKISIFLPRKEYEFYATISQMKAYERVFMGLIAIPVLVEVFNQLKNEGYSDLVDIEEEHRWFKSIVQSYKRAQKEELTIDRFKSIKSLELAQIVFGNMNIKAIVDFSNIVSQNIEGDSNE